MRTNVLLSSLVVLVALAGCGVTPQDIDEIKGSQKDILAKLEALDGEIKKVKAAPAAPTRPQVDPDKVFKIPLGDSPVKGAKDGKVTIVKFSDYQCPFCAKADPLVTQVLEAYPNDVKYAYKQFPLTTIHPNAMPAAKAALAAGKQGKYWEMHKKLFENYRALGADDLKKYAGEIGLDVAQWEKDMNSKEIQDQINAEMQQARAAEVRGTPTIFVNGKRLMNRSFDGFKAAIDAALKG